MIDALTESMRKLPLRPSRGVGAGVAAVAAALTGFVCLAAVAHGTDTPADVGTWTSLALMAISLVGMAVSHWRAVYENRSHWDMLTWAYASSAVGEALLSIRAASWLQEHWPTVADAGILGFYVLLVVFFVRHLMTGDRANLYMQVIDSLLVAGTVTFLLWVLVLCPGLGPLDQYSATSQVMVVVYPFLDCLVAVILLLLLIIGYTPARLAGLLGMIAMTTADVMACSGWLTTSPRMVVAASFWVLAYGLLVVAIVLPAGAPVVAHRPTVWRVLVVHGSLAIALAVGMWQYVLRDAEATTVGVTLGALIAVFFAGSQVAAHFQASRWADQLSEHIEQLQVAQDELRELVDDLPNAVVVLDERGTIVEANGPAASLTGRSRSDLLGMSFIEIFDPTQRHLLMRAWRGLHQGDPMERPTLRVDRPDGSLVLVEADANLPVRDPRRVTIALRDVTEGVAAADRLFRARERFRLAFHGAPTGMALSSLPDRVILDVNLSLEKMLGRSRDDLIGRTIDDIGHPDDRGHLPMPTVDDDGAISLSDGTQFRHDRRYLRGDGGVVWARTWVSVMDDGDGGQLAIAHIEDITERRHNEERLEYAANHDGLTGLPNRFRFLERLGVHLEHSPVGSIAVLFIDLDNFKVINDSLGHEAGDILLMELAERLRSVVRDRDLLGRFGGDEFIVMLRDVGGTHDPLDIADRLRREIARPVIIDGAELFVTASIGITFADRDGITTTELLRDADAAMYRAKARGRDCVEVFSQDSHDATVLVLRTTSELRRGLERGEIVPYYQPVVELASGQLVGFEVLARWRHPDRGLLGPEQFLPMAEETGLISDVGSAVLRSSLVQLGQWRNGNPRFADLSVSVNVSVRQLMSGRMAEVVAEALAESGVTANGLWLEITETALMADVKAASIALRDLRSLGLHLAVDDFGTGYSSLTYLKRFPVEAIKVDRTFINGLGIDTEDSTIVEAVVNLGHSLGLSVVAEGVETPLQLARLRELGCDRGQGYLFGRPRPPELVEAEYSLV
ncbi:MAG TPA: EAL domain-containing protein [Ilumatobacteraceae bacterium]|nr:EAL domain-containing protein [Ilumatobacteraceae bacterium]